MLLPIRWRRSSGSGAGRAALPARPRTQNRVQRPLAKLTPIISWGGGAEAAAVGAGRAALPARTRHLHRVQRPL
ncbi:MAG: hypothetical protein U0175_29290 [Caldilineaceae bacterium]